LTTLNLKRTKFALYGILGNITDDSGKILYFTLEHAFPQPDGTYAPKLNTGEHLCILGTHQLDHGGPFQAFEITGVPGHSGILIHVGNYNKDSDGCVLIGESLSNCTLVDSRLAFDDFMQRMGTDDFTLLVS
jgi:hypothetical protein